jgi:polynucleotide 5'-kinase involved in rRNA processing
MQNVAKMERSLLEQERNFKNAKDAALQGSPDIKDATLRDLERKEMEFVGSNTKKIREIQFERERLDRER